jgi:hypothetical protein
VFKQFATLVNVVAKRIKALATGCGVFYELLLLLLFVVAADRP